MKSTVKRRPTAERPGRLAAAIEPAVREWLPLFREVSDWAVCAHMTPDADTLGSSLALARLIRRLGSSATVVCADAVLPRYAFLPDAQDVVIGGLPEGLPADAGVVVLDAADLGRLGPLAAELSARRLLVNLDHHVSNRRFGTHNWIDLQSAATGELIYLLYDHFGLPIDVEAAAALYAALVTDTGIFRYPATKARTMAIAGELLAAGIDHAALIADIYERQPAGAVRLHGMALAGLRLEAHGRVAWTSVPLTMFQDAQAGEADAEGIVERMREIEGVEVLYVLRESEGGGVRVSLRSKTDFDCNLVARRFGGGGHRQSAGCVIDDSLASAERRLLAVVREQLAAVAS